MKRTATAALAAGLATLISYPLVMRPWLLGWGATADEVTDDLPGDDIVARPRTTSTRAITIDAEPEDVWPWLAQLGQGRGGMYSYDLLENMFGLDIHTVDQVVPELQAIKPGDRIQLFPRNEKADLFLEVAVADPDHALVLRGPDSPKAAFATGMGYPSWAFVIRAAGPGRARLIVRWRCDFEPTVRGYLSWKYGIEPVHFVMERRMLKGIKSRAEALRAARGGRTATSDKASTGRSPRGAEPRVGTFDPPPGDLRPQSAERWREKTGS